MAGIVVRNSSVPSIELVRHGGLNGHDPRRTDVNETRTETVARSPVPAFAALQRHWREVVWSRSASAHTLWVHASDFQCTSHGSVGAPVEYVPILRGKLGEILALRHASSEVLARTRPVLELTRESRPSDIVQTFARASGEHLPKGVVVTLDCGTLWRDGSIGTGYPGRAMSWLGLAFDQWCQPLIPVFRLTDPAEALAEVRTTHLLHGQGGCLRLNLNMALIGHDGLSRAVVEVLDTVALRPDRVDLIVDAGFVEDERAVHELGSKARTLLDWAAQEPWRHVALAAGSFPSSIKGFLPDRRHLLRRWEIDLWRQAVGSTRPDFADYGTTHPIQIARGRGRRGTPNLRYTCDDGSWWLFKAAGEAEAGFLKLCRVLADCEAQVSHSAQRSWGDQEFVDRALGITSKPGNGTYWRAWATSRHLAVVASKLSKRGTP